MAETDSWNIEMGENTADENQEEEVNGAANEGLYPEFVRYIEEWLIHNLFQLSGQALRNIYLQLHAYFTACSYTGHGWLAAPNPSPESGDINDESNEEPPTLSREN